MTSSADLARFLRTGGDSLANLGEAMHQLATALETADVLEPEGHDGFALPEARGPKQQALVDRLLAVGEDGLKTADLARSASMDQPNTYLALQALTKQGLVEMVPGAKPQHWRLAARYRLSREIIDAANSVREGEWTTYGDISQVVYGHSRAGQAVGRVMSTSHEVEHPHRILSASGQIPAMWRDRLGQDRGECAARLQSEGVDVSEDYFAHGRHWIGHEEIAKRIA